MKHLVLATIDGEQTPELEASRLQLEERKQQFLDDLECLPYRVLASLRAEIRAREASQR